MTNERATTTRSHEVPMIRAQQHSLSRRKFRQALRLMAEGCTLADAARKVCRSRRWLERLVHDYKASLPSR